VLARGRELDAEAVVPRRQKRDLPVTGAGLNSVSPLAAQVDDDIRSGGRELEGGLETDDGLTAALLDTALQLARPRADRLGGVQQDLEPVQSFLKLAVLFKGDCRRVRLGERERYAGKDGDSAGKDDRRLSSRGR
jgi:hypothetical protein